MNRIWITRDEPAGGPLSQAISGAGLVPIHCPVVHRRKLGDAREELAQLTENDWIVLTSAYAVDCLDLELAKAPQVAVVGSGTEKFARTRGLRVDLVNQDGDSDALWDTLRQSVTSGIICYPRSTLATSPAGWNNVKILSPIVYETMGIAFDRSIMERVDAAAVTSKSAVCSIGKVDLPLASIGPKTSLAVRELGMEPWVEANAPTFVALAEAITTQARAARNQPA